MKFAKKMERAWNSFFYAPVDPAPVALYRILGGLLALACYGSLLPWLRMWFGAEGVLTHATSRILTGSPRLDLLAFAPDSDTAMIVLICAFLLCLCALTLGFRTRTAAVGAFLGMTTFHHRNITILAGGDILMRLMCFFLIFSGAGKVWSVDAWLSRKRSVSQARGAPWAQRLMQYQLTLLYVSAAISKFSGKEWLDGTALYYSSRLQDFWRFPVPYVFDHMWTLKLLTWSVLVAEFVIPVFLWIPRFRLWAFTLGFTLHLGIEYAMNVPYYSFAMLISYAVFLKPEEARALVSRLARLAGATQARRRASPSRA